MLNNCVSTHGGAGYAPGSTMKDGKMVCGSCGVEIEFPRPIGYQFVYPPAPNSFFQRLIWKLGLAKRTKVPRWSVDV